MSITFIDLVFFNYAFDGFYRFPLFIGLAVITYWIGLIGFHKRNEIIVKPKRTLSSGEEKELQKIEKRFGTVDVREKTIYRS